MGLIGKEKVRLRKFPRWDFPINLLTTKEIHQRMYLCRTSIASYTHTYYPILFECFFLMFLIQDFLYRLVKSDRLHDL